MSTNPRINILKIQSLFSGILKYSIKTHATVSDNEFRFSFFFFFSKYWIKISLFNVRLYKPFLGMYYVVLKSTKYFMV